jgi:hypothetical protein
MGTPFKIKVGSIFKYRPNGEHNDYKLVVLHDAKSGQRFLYNMDYECEVGIINILYAEYTGEKLTKKEIREIMEKIK